MVPMFRTLADLRQSLAVSLGFGAMAGVIDLQIPILNELLQQAQAQLWRDVKWRYLFKQHKERLGVNQRVLDMPDDAPLGTISGVFAEYNGCSYELRAGIIRTGEVSRGGIPRFYEQTARAFGVYQIEFDPIPEDEPVLIRIEYYAAPARFKVDTDYCSIPDDILLALAVVKGKAHYRQPDVQLHTDVFSAMLRKAKIDNFGVTGSADFRRKNCHTASHEPQRMVRLETRTEQDDTPYWDEYVAARNKSRDMLTATPAIPRVVYRQVIDETRYWEQYQRIRKPAVNDVNIAAIAPRKIEYIPIPDATPYADLYASSRSKNK